MKKFIGLHLDFVGFVGSTLCAIHCALFPLLIAFGVLNISILKEHAIYEHLFLGLAAVIALVSLSQGYFKHHKNALPCIMTIVGFSLIFLTHDHAHGLSSAIFMVIAGTLIALSHFVNWRLMKKSK